MPLHGLVEPDMCKAPKGLCLYFSRFRVICRFFSGRYAFEYTNHVGGLGLKSYQMEEETGCITECC